jgi:hypothetical protein
VPLALHDVDDAQELVRRVVARSGLNLTFHERDDLEQYLLVQCWQLSLKYEPGRITKGFGVYATVTLRRRVIDWQRSTWGTWGRRTWKWSDGRAYTREQRQTVSLDADDSDRDRLEQTLAQRAGDPAADCDADWRRLYAERNRNRAGDYDLLGFGDAA